MGRKKVVGMSATAKTSAMPFLFPRGEMIGIRLVVRPLVSSVAHWLLSWANATVMGLVRLVCFPSGGHGDERWSTDGIVGLVKRPVRPNPKYSDRYPACGAPVCFLRRVWNGGAEDGGAEGKID